MHIYIYEKLKRIHGKTTSNNNKIADIKFMYKNNRFYIYKHKPVRMETTPFMLSKYK